MSDRTPPTEFTHEAGQMTGEGPYTPRTSTTAAGRALLAELAESPLPGARYAHDVVSRRILAIEAEARASQAEYDFVSGPGIPPHQCAPLDVERLREAVDAALFDAEMDDSHPGCRAKWRRVAMGAFDVATSA